MLNYDMLLVRRPGGSPSTISRNSHYTETLDWSPGRPAGYSRNWGDASLDVQRQVIDSIASTAQSYGLSTRDTAYILAIARNESGFNPDAAAGNTSASGIGQFVDQTGNTYGLNSANRFDLQSNVDALVRHYLYNKQIVDQRGEGEEYIYKYYHDGEFLEFGGLELSKEKVMPWVDMAEKALTGSSDEISGISPDDFETLGIGGIPILEQSVLDFESAESTNPAPFRYSASPIVLDLDSDGIETTGATAGAYFDHNGNGFAEQTGWVGADDGLLVWDRNGDGRINDGTELFGNETLLSDGTKAANGYAALAELDSNMDGKVDANDAGFANLKVWKDLDGDGYSSTNELFNLIDAGIQSLDTAYATSTYVDANGNEHRQLGAFTKTDGTTGTTADVWFKTDPLYTIQEQYLTAPADIAALPDLRGYGDVYDLQQAMARDTTGSLKTLVESFVAETARASRNALLEQILFKWTGADTVDPASRGGSIDARKLAVLERFYGRDYVGTNGANPIPDAVPLLNRSYEGLSEMLYAQLMAQTHLKPLYDLIVYSWDSATQSIRGDMSAVASSLRSQVFVDSQTAYATLNEFQRTVHGFQAQTTLDYTGFRAVLAAQDAGLAIVYDAYAQTSLIGSDGADNYSVSSGANLVLGYDGNDVIRHVSMGNGVLDGGAGDDTIWVTASRDAAAPHLRNVVHGGVGNDQLYSGSSADTYLFNRGDGQDLINDYDAGLAGATDTIAFGAGIAFSDLTFQSVGADLVIGVTDPANPFANDRLTLQNWFYHPIYNIEALAFADGTTLGTTTLYERFTTGTEANDTLLGWWDMSQIFRGYGGNDTIGAGRGNDTIDAGDGNDTVNDGGGNNTIDGGGGDDSITSNGSGTNIISAGTGHDTVAINGPGANSVLAGDGNDNVQVHYDTDNTIDGGAGDDFLLVWRNGGSALHHNTFTGGLGNDQLYGTASADTYIFSRGDGQDTLNDYDYGAQGATDTIAFGTGVSQSDLAVSRSGDHLLIGIDDPNNPTSTDQITIQWWYADATHHRIEQFSFADGTTLTNTEIETLGLPPPPPPPPPNTVYGTAADDTLNTGAGNDTVYGLGGADTLRDTGGSNTLDGGEGNDTITTVNHASSTLIGGTGDDLLLVDRDGGSPITHNTFQGGTGSDWLYGSASTDTYLFNRGDRDDWVNDYDVNAQGANDTIAFGAGINPLDLVFRQNGSHLQMSVHGTTDSVNVQWWYADPSHHHVETIRAGNGSTLVDTQVEQLIQAMATFGAQNGGLTWDQAIDQRPDDVQAILAANWMPAS